MVIFWDSVTGKEESFTLHLSQNSCFISFNVQNTHHTTSYNAELEWTHGGWQQDGSFKRLRNLLENFTRGEENPLKKKFAAGVEKLSHRLQEVLQEEVLLNTNYPSTVFFSTACASGFFQDTNHQATNYNSIHFYILSAYMNPWFPWPLEQECCISSLFIA